MRNRNKYLATAMGAMALALASMSVAWACGNFAATDMVLANADDQPYDGPGSADVGKNWTDCPIGLYDNNPHGCMRPVTVTGKNFENNIPTTTISQVTLYWVDEPFYAAGLGGPNGRAEEIESDVCMTMGVKLGTATVTSKAFVATVNIPPQNNMTEGGTTSLGVNVPPTYRIGAGPTSPPNSGKFYYGTNVICAVWDHTVGGLTHKGSIGNSYNAFF